MARKITGSAETSAGPRTSAEIPDTHRKFAQEVKEKYKVPEPKGPIALHQWGGLNQEMARLQIPPPLGGFGITMIGPTVLQYGTDEQKQKTKERMSNR